METPTEKFRRATAATCRAIAGRDDIILAFDGNRTAYFGVRISIAPPSEPLESREIKRVRGEADTSALRFAHHDPRLHNRLAPANEAARSLFDTLERVRYESLGARRMQGVALNLAHSLEAHCQALKLDTVTQRDPKQLSEAVQLLVGEAMDHPVPGTAQGFVDLWRGHLLPEIESLLPELAHAVQDQLAFARTAQAILGKLGFSIESGTVREQTKAELRDPDEDVLEREGEEVGLGQAPPESDPLDSVDIFDGSTDDPGVGEKPLDEFGAEEDETDETEEQFRHGFTHNKFPPDPYHVYTFEFDEVVEAAEICDPRELIRLRLQLDRQLSLLQSVIGCLANRLQRRLLARQARSWVFDQEEGLLDTARLARVVANPNYSLSYKWEKETPFRDTIVTLLIDNSGSMRGRPITLAAISADVLARTLERCAVKTEILGFTTRTWKGGRTYERWMAGGKKDNPGRLNELRHIVYKSADVPWRRARKNLGLMLREGVLKENIDGEALLWAHQRLLARSEQRRILMVISDGTPVDDATLANNSRDYLDRHLHQVIQYIENETPVELLAIGIGHDVTRYYHRAVTLVDAEQLGGTMMEELANLFSDNSWGSALR